MSPYYLIEQHEKQVKILRCIETARYRNDCARADLAKINRLEVWHPSRDRVEVIKERVRTHNAAIERLTALYVKIEQQRYEKIMNLKPLTTVVDIAERYNQLKAVS